MLHIVGMKLLHQFCVPVASVLRSSCRVLLSDETVRYATVPSANSLTVDIMLILVPNCPTTVIGRLLFNVHILSLSNVPSARFHYLNAKHIINYSVF